MHIIDSPVYRQAFLQYLRKGTPLDIALKAAEQQERGTTQYIWRTMGDGKVRAAHAANDGRVFSWDVRPSTGHPGEDFNCRCTAEPYIKGTSEFAYQNLVTVVRDVMPKWTNYDLSRHYYQANGRGVSLSKIGHLQGVIDYYFYALGKNKDVINQVIEAARSRPAGEFIHYVYNSYEFRPYLYVFGGGIVSAIFRGNISHVREMMILQGNINYYYDDIFTDPLSIRELYEDEHSRLEDLNWFERRLEIGGDYFPIKDHWRSELYAEAKFNRETSIYYWPR